MLKKYTVALELDKIVDKFKSFLILLITKLHTNIKNV